MNVKQSLKRTATVAGVAALAAMALSATGPSAHAAGVYTIVIDTTSTVSVAKYCLVTKTSDAMGANKCATLDGVQRARLQVPYSAGEKVWIDIHYQERGRSDLGIDLRGKHYLRVNDHLHSYDPPISINEVCGWISYASRDSGNLGLGLHNETLCNW